MRNGSAPTLLGFDTATEACSAAVFSGGAVIATQWERQERGHAERLVPMVLATMAEARIGFDALDAIVVTVGPGSFTGVRVGLATARGLALASGKPLIGLGTLLALAAAVPPAERAGASLLAVVTALPGQVYAQAFDAMLEPVAPPAVCGLSDALGLVGVGAALVVGSGAPAVLEAVPERDGRFRPAAASPWPHAAALVSHAASLIQRSSIEALSTLPVTPLYLKAPGIGMSAVPAIELI